MNKRKITAGFLCAAALVVAAVIHADEANADEISASDFSCLTDLTPVGGFFVGNLKGDVEATVKVASSTTGGVYPAGSVVQLVPTEVMVKGEPGFNPATKDWEFFELGVSNEGTTITSRGFVETVNRFGGNCFGCHIQARPEWDLICGQDHGCAPIPLTPVMITAIQKTDPRCAPVELSADEIGALKALAAAMQPADK